MSEDQFKMIVEDVFFVTRGAVATGIIESGSSSTM